MEDKNQPFILNSANTTNSTRVGPPPVMQQIANFFTSTVNHVVNGMPQTSDPEQEKRLAICRGCDRYNENDGNPKCMDCGCYLKIKTSWAGESCPQKKWLPVIQTGGCNCNQ